MKEKDFREDFKVISQTWVREFPDEDFISRDGYSIHLWEGDRDEFIKRFEASEKLGDDRYSRPEGDATEFSVSEGTYDELFAATQRGSFGLRYYTFLEGTFKPRELRQLIRSDFLSRGG